MILVVTLSIVCSACGVTRKLSDGEYLLQRVDIKTDKSVPHKERITDLELEQYIRQSPNKRFLGTNFYVWAYNLANPEKQNWWNNLKRKVGEQPVLLDMSLTQNKTERKFFRSAAQKTSTRQRR